MSLVFTARLWAGSFTSSGVDAFTVPSPHRYVVKTIQLYNDAATAGHANITTSGGLTLLITPDIAGKGSWQWEGTLVLNAGETLHLGTVAGPFYGFICGYDFLT